MNFIYFQNSIKSLGKEIKVAFLVDTSECMMKDNYHNCNNLKKIDVVAQCVYGLWKSLSQESQNCDVHQWPIQSSPNELGPFYKVDFGHSQNVTVTEIVKKFQKVSTLGNILFKIYSWTFTLFISIVIFRLSVA